MPGTAAGLPSPVAAELRRQLEDLQAPTLWVGQLSVSVSHCAGVVCAGVCGIQLRIGKMSDFYKNPGDGSY